MNVYKSNQKRMIGPDALRFQKGDDPLEHSRRVVERHNKRTRKPSEIQNRECIRQNAILRGQSLRVVGRWPE